MLKLQPDPTFKAKVDIPVPGDKPVAVEFTFKYRDQEQMDAFLFGEAGKARAAQSAAEANKAALLDVATDWSNVDTPFSAEAIEAFVKRYPSATALVMAKYIAEVGGARLGN